jgi:hypothetical protein
MHLDSGSVTTIAVFLAAQTGALIFYAGKLASTVGNHDRRLDKLESTQEKQTPVVAQLAMKEGIQL